MIYSIPIFINVIINLYKYKKVNIYYYFVVKYVLFNIILIYRGVYHEKIISILYMFIC